MKKQYLIWSTLAVLFVVGLATESQAQRPAHYYPTRPTFSPYMFYRQFNGTGLPNYYTFVRPRSIYRDFLKREQAPSVQRNQRLINEGDVSVIVDNALRERATTGIGQAAQAGRFMDTSHFYPSAATQRRR